MFEKGSKCALIMAPCPRTNDEQAPIYCPNWVTNVPEVKKDGTGRVTAEVFYTGCQLRRQVLYQLSITASAGQAAASADKSANLTAAVFQEVERILTDPARILVGMGMVTAIQEQRLERLAATSITGRNLLDESTPGEF